MLALPCHLVRFKCIFRLRTHQHNKPVTFTKSKKLGLFDKNLSFYLLGHMPHPNEH